MKTVSVCLFLHYKIVVLAEMCTGVVTVLRDSSAR